MAAPISRTFATVPRPGFWRSGIHSSRTTPPMIVTTVPIDRPVSFDRPWWRTFHGSRPRPLRTSSAELAPYSSRPATSWESRRGMRRDARPRRGRDARPRPERGARPAGAAAWEAAAWDDDRDKATPGVVVWWTGL
ncbi:hypothetical protein BG846_00089 [Streptomyces fradiae ATCC 10745 = DSM 40063]|uniref:Uncharacterized protein n=1 Tax=Streptomyces fradiae ATCC 10745 = DSM 40063 TaxID=1319510 RepID=A0A1Y2P391_STRFR|nr:hypothetical protein BG846_00089 [Streptomyces fradiae ATCC 10745 = DSM 40063]